MTSFNVLSPFLHSFEKYVTQMIFKESALFLTNRAGFLLSSPPDFLRPHDCNVNQRSSHSLAGPWNLICWGDTYRNPVCTLGKEHCSERWKWSSGSSKSDEGRGRIQPPGLSAASKKSHTCGLNSLLRLPEDAAVGESRRVSLVFWQKWGLSQLWWTFKARKDERDIKHRVGSENTCLFGDSPDVGTDCRGMKISFLKGTSLGLLWYRLIAFLQETQTNKAASSLFLCVKGFV